MELAFQSDVYSGTEQLPLRNDTICVDIIMGILERDVIVNIEATNGTAESEIVLLCESGKVFNYYIIHDYL